MVVVDVTGGFDNVVSTIAAPLDLGGIHLISNGNRLTIHDKLVAIVHDSTRIAAVDCIVLQ